MCLPNGRHRIEIYLALELNEAIQFVEGANTLTEYFISITFHKNIENHSRDNETERIRFSLKKKNKFIHIGYINIKFVALFFHKDAQWKSNVPHGRFVPLFIFSSPVWT